MLHILLLLFFYLILSFGFGSLVNQFFKISDLFSLKLLNGLLCIGLISSIISFFLPLNFIYEIVLLVVGTGLSIVYKFSFKFKKSLLIFVVLTSLLASMESFIFDFYSYYLPTIRFLDDYGLVKGLANFDFNLGQTSFWHILQASTNNVFDFSYKLNAFLILIYLIYIYEQKLYKYMIFLPVFYLFVASPSPDLPIIIISLICIDQYLRNKNTEMLVYCFTISCFLILIKTISVSLFMFFAICLAINWKNLKVKYFILPVLLGAIYFSKNLVLSGNLFFPTFLKQFPSLFYSLPEIVYINNDDMIKYLVTKMDYIPFEDFKKWDKKDYYQYVFTSFNIFTFLYIFFALIHLFFLIFMIYKRNKTMIILGSALLFKVILFFIVSIQYRFILDGLILILFISFYEVKIKSFFIFIPAFLFSLMIFILPILGKKNIYFFKFGSSYSFSNLLIQKIKEPKTVPYKLGNMNVNLVYNESLSGSMKQPALNITLLKMYYWQDMIPQLINENDISEGYILSNNNQQTRREIKYLIYKISEYNKKKSEN